MQVPVALNDTVSPDDAVAETSKSESPYVTPVGAVNEIVCAAGTTEWLLSRVVVDDVEAGVGEAAAGADRIHADWLVLSAVVLHVSVPVTFAAWPAGLYVIAGSSARARSGWASSRTGSSC